MDWFDKLNERESAWVFQVLLVLGAFLILHLLFKGALKRLGIKFSDKSSPVKHSFFEAIRTPVTVLIWLVASTLIINIVLIRINPDFPTDIITQIFSLIVIACITWFGLTWTNRFKIALLQTHSFNGHHLDKAKIDVISKLAYLFIGSVAVLLGLEILGFNMATLVTIGGISGISLAFASKDVIANFFGGMMIYITRPFSIGDYIKIKEKDLEGSVEEIGWYYTSLYSYDKLPIYIPNSLFSTAIVINQTRRKHWTFEETVSIRYKDLQAVPALVEAINNFFKSHPLFDGEELLRIHLEHLSPSSLDISILATATITDSDEIAKLKQECLLKIAQLVADHQASFAFPVITTIDIPNEICIKSIK